MNLSTNPVRRIALLLCALAPLGLAAGCASTTATQRDQKYADYGEPMQHSEQPVMKIEDLVAWAGDLDGKPVRVQGKVSSVCLKKGCWLRMAPAGSDRTVFVKFTCPVDGHLVPVAAVGHDAIVEGIVTVTTLSEDDARHYAEDAGKSPAEIAKIVGNQRDIQIQAPSARILGLSAQ